MRVFVAPICLLASQPSEWTRDGTDSDLIQRLPLLLRLIGLMILVFGAWSAVVPRHSIVLYQWIMARCNWRVVPIDEPREILTTRFLGATLILLSLSLFWLLRA